MNRMKRYLTLKQRQQRAREARRLRAAQREALVALGQKALIAPHSRFRYRR